MERDVLAAGFLLLVVTLVGVAAARRALRCHFTPVQLVFYLLATVLARCLWGARGSRRLNLPAGRGAVIVANHRSSVDPFFLQVLANRPIHWMVAREYSEHPAFAWFVRGICQAIPVNRGGADTAATKAAIRLAAQGELIGVFPEGRINMTDQFMLPGRPGAVVLALRAQVPIVPCYIQGSPFDRVPWSPFFMTARVRIELGEPIDLSAHYGQYGDRDVVEQLMTRCLRAIAELANRGDFEPVLAGRHWKPSREEVEQHQAASRRRRRRPQIEPPR